VVISLVEKWRAVKMKKIAVAGSFRIAGESPSDEPVHVQFSFARLTLSRAS
jgi:hypothetical protein